MGADEFIYAVLADCLSQRIYPDVLPEDAVYPAVVYQRLGGTPTQTMDVGVVTEECRYQVDVYATSRKDARRVARDCARLLTTNERLVCLCQDERDSYESEVRRYRTSLDLSIWENHDE